MGKIAALFAGQGTQYPGMGKALIAENMAANRMFAALTELEPNLPNWCFASSKEELMETKLAQPCLFAVEMSIAAALDDAGIPVEAVAGFSLGEIPALTFAGFFSPNTGFRVVQERASQMQKAAEAKKGSMLAVVKMTASQVEALCAKISDVYPVNYNSPEQTVVAGTPEALEQLKTAVKNYGGRALPLSVSGAFHSPMMNGASEQLADYLDPVEQGTPSMPVYANQTARPYEWQIAKQQIATQVNHPVRWQETIQNLWEEGFDTFIEIGPGTTLSGLVKRILPGATTYSVETPESFIHCVASLKEGLSC